MKWFPVLLTCAVVLIAGAKEARAVPPPDFIFNVGTQVAQVFSIAFLVLSAMLSSLYQVIRLRLTTGKRRVFYWGGAIVVMFGVAAVSAWGYGSYAQRKVYEDWLANSRAHAVAPSTVTSTDKATERLSGSVDVSGLGDTAALDLLSFSQTTKTASGIASRPDDAVADFIRRYYAFIASGQWAQAYDLSKKSVPFATFKSWYVGMQALTIDKMQRIDENKTSLELTLVMPDETTRYGVLMDVARAADGQPVRVNTSTVRVLGTVQTTRVSPETTSTTTTDFFDLHRTRPLMATNAEFDKEVKRGLPGAIVLDARENIEYDNGHFPNSIHIRLADLKAGRWIELPSDKVIYTLCWSGIRGKETADFLRSKRLVASYLEGGADGWVTYGGLWSGKIKFNDVYKESRYQVVFSKNEVRSSVAKGTVLVDCRGTSAYLRSHIPDSINLSLISTPTLDLETAFAQVPSGSTVITVCDGWVNCFDAKLVGVELERRGNTFLGRYNTPWDWPTRP